MILRQNAQNSATGIAGHVVADPRSPSPSVYGYHYIPDGGGAFLHAHAHRSPGADHPQAGQQRANFLFRQGASDNWCTACTHRRKFELAQLAKYGYIEEFGLQSEDKSGAKTDSRFFPVHEVAFIMQDGTQLPHERRRLQTCAAQGDIHAPARRDRHRTDRQVGPNCSSAQVARG